MPHQTQYKVGIFVRIQQKLENENLKTSSKPQLEGKYHKNINFSPNV